MFILAIETTGAFASVAATDGTRITAHVEGNDRYAHLQNLMPQVEQVLEESGSKIGGVTGIAVSVGPGSFTGIRIGVSSARALSQILKIPCFPISSLEALALRGVDAAKGALICPMLDARRSQVYAGAYRIEGGMPVEAVPAGPYTLGEFMDRIGEYDDVFLMGDACDIYAEKISALRTGPYRVAGEAIRYQHADAVARLGAAAAEAGAGVAYEDLKPEYMRIPEAERKLREKQAKGDGPAAGIGPAASGRPGADGRPAAAGTKEEK